MAILSASPSGVVSVVGAKYQRPQAEDDRRWAGESRGQGKA